MRVSARHLGFLMLVLSLVFALTAIPAFAQQGTATPLPTTVPSTVGGDNPLAIGETVEGELTNSQPSVSYTLNLDTETTFSATLTAEDFDCYLVLQDQYGNEVAYDDDSAGSLDSRLTYTASPGVYTLIAESYSYRNSLSPATGSYTLSLHEQTISRIEYGQSIEAELTTDNLDLRYVFTGTAGDVIIAQNLSDSFDSYLTLEQNGQQLMSDDDSAGNLDSRIGPYTLPSTGQYTLIATSLSHSSTGPLTITLDRVQLANITFGEATNVELTPNHQAAFFQFQGHIGDTINVEVESDVDTNLAISDPSNYNIITDEDSGAGRNPEVQDLSLSYDGTYTLIVRSTSGESGPVSVTIERAPIPTLNDGPQTVRFNSSVYNRTLSFTAEPNTVYRMTMTLSNGSQGSPSVTLTQNGSQIAYTSASYVQGMSVDFRSIGSGDIIVQMSDYSYSNTSYQVTIEPVGQ